MANLQMCYIRFDETIEKCVQHLGLDGKVYKDNLMHLYRMQIAFQFKHRYLSVLDFIQYELNEIEPKKVLDDTVKHLVEIKKQFKYYFNAIWC